MNKNFLSNLLSQRCIQQGYEVLNKISISVLNFSTESAKERTIYDFLFLIAIYSPKNDNKHPSKMRNQHYCRHFTTTTVTNYNNNLL